MLSSKQRAKLRGLANPIDTILQVGKGGVADALVKQWTTRSPRGNSSRCRVLETSPEPVREVATRLRRRPAPKWYR